MKNCGRGTACQINLFSQLLHAQDNNKMKFWTRRPATQGLNWIPDNNCNRELYSSAHKNLSERSDQLAYGKRRPLLSPHFKCDRGQLVTCISRNISLYVSRRRVIQTDECVAWWVVENGCLVIIGFRCLYQCSMLLPYLQLSPTVQSYHFTDFPDALIGSCKPCPHAHSCRMPTMVV
jgi:hypothetical protein